MSRPQAPPVMAAALVVAAATAVAGPAWAQTPDAVSGPYERLLIRGATVVDGTGAHPISDTDILIEGNRITAVRQWNGPPLQPGEVDRVIDASGMYVLPGFVDMHGHIRDQPAGLPPEYIFKLWLSHGITTVRDAASHRGIAESVDFKKKSAQNAIAAPRIFVYARTDLPYTAQQTGWEGGPITTPETAREFVRWAAAQGVDGFKSYGFPPDIFQALVDEANQNALGTAVHLAQVHVARLDAVDAARMGVTTLEHFYGLAEALLDGHDLNDYLVDYDYRDEVDRFRGVGLLWEDAAAPGSEKWREVMDALLASGVTLDPTFSIYNTYRDVEKALNGPWMDEYTHPGTLSLFVPSRELHASFFYHWTTEFEVEYRNMYQRWMAFVNEFKNRGGRVTIGTDAGVGLSLYGFSFVRDLEILQEAGFTPLEAVRSATLEGARTIMEPKGLAPDFGTVEPGKLADLVLVEENPLANFKVLYATGTYHLDEDSGEIGRSQGIRYVVKDGIVYDADRLRQDVLDMVREAKASDRWRPAGP